MLVPIIFDLTLHVLSLNIIQWIMLARIEMYEISSNPRCILMAGQVDLYLEFWKSWLEVSLLIVNVHGVPATSVKFF